MTEWRGHRKDISSLTFSVWDTLRLTEGERHPLPFTNTFIAAVAPGGQLAAFGSWSDDVILWDAETGQLRSRIRSSTNRIFRLVFSPDGRSLAAAIVPPPDAHGGLVSNRLHPTLAARGVRPEPQLSPDIPGTCSGWHCCPMGKH